ncbi:hypothetical protein FOZ63_003930, partial [Perkinsus olseni]
YSVPLLMSTALATGFVLLPCIATALQSGSLDVPVTSEQYRSLVKRIERVEDAVGALAVSRPSHSCETDAAREGAGVQLVMVERSKFSIMTARSSDKAVFETETDDEIDAAYQHFAPLMPLAHLEDETLERLKTMLPDGKNEGRCRRIFALLAANPPKGYDSEIDWVTGWHADNVPEPNVLRKLVGTWNEGSAEDRKQNAPADDRGRAARGGPTERYNSKERRNRSKSKRVSLTPDGRRSDAAVWKPKQPGGSA